MSDDDIRAELESHLALRADHLEATGASENQARDTARKMFGNVLKAHEDTRAVSINTRLESLFQDIRYAIRGFAHRPGFTLTALAILAIGIAAPTAVFSVVDRLLIRPLPYTDPDRLVWLGMTAPIAAEEFLLDADFAQWRRNQTAFSQFTSMRGAQPCDLNETRPERLRCLLADREFLPTFGVAPVLGRNFTREEDQPNAPPVVLLSHRYWQSRFGGSPQAINQVLRIDGRSSRVIGVLPASFELPNLRPFDVMLPQQVPETARPNGPQYFLGVFARLKPGFTVESSRASVEPLFQESLKTVPPSFRPEVQMHVNGLRDKQVRDTRLAAMVLFGATGCVFLIAIANLANLLLARAASREQELSIRTALGAGRWRLARQTFVETGLLGFVGGVAGIVIAEMMLRTLVSLAPRGIARLEEAALDARVLVFAIALSAVSALLAALVPAFTSHARATGPRRQPLRAALVAAQLAFSVVLLSGAALLGESLLRMQRIPLGVDPSQVYSARLTLGREAYPRPEAQATLFQTLEDRLRVLPGVNGVAITDALPPTDRMMMWIWSNMEVFGKPYVPGRPTGGMIHVRSVNPDYFPVLGIPIRAGRNFVEADRRATDVRAVIVSEIFAARMFPQENPIGRRFRPHQSERWFEVVGVAANVKNNPLGQADEPEFYQIALRGPAGPRYVLNFLLRSTAPASQVRDRIAAEIRTIDPALPMEFTPLVDRYGDLTAKPRFQTWLLGLFAAAGLLLAALGIAGVVAFLVTRNKREIGVRMALGAERSQVVQIFVRRALRWIAAGIAIGLAATIPLGQSIRAMLFEAPPSQPFMLASAASLLAVIATIAAWLPARRAASVDPTQALRQDG